MRRICSALRPAFKFVPGFMISTILRNCAEAERTPREVEATDLLRRVSGDLHKLRSRPRRRIASGQWLELRAQRVQPSTAHQHPTRSGRGPDPVVRCGRRHTASSCPPCCPASAGSGETGRSRALALRRSVRTSRITAAAQRQPASPGNGRPSPNVGASACCGNAGRMNCSGTKACGPAQRPSKGVGKGAKWP